MDFKSTAFKCSSGKLAGASLAGGFGGGGPRAPMQPQAQEARSQAELMAGIAAHQKL